MRTNGKAADDERRGLPSASSARRYELCSASYLLEQKARELGQVAHEGSQAATRGEIIHQWLAGESVSLSPADLELAEFLRARANDQVTRIFGDRKPKEYVEKRLWLKQGNKPLLSGKFDRVLIDGALALCQDFKTGYSVVETAELNSQLKWLATLIGINAPLVEEVVVQLVTRSQGVTEARYTVKDLETSYNEIHATLTKLFDKASEPTPHPDACKWCPAALVCQALNKIVEEVPTKSQVKVKPLPTGGKAATELLNVIATLRVRFDEIEEFYTGILKDYPTAIPEWQLAPGPARRDVSDWATATKRLEEFIPATELTGIANWKITEVEALLGGKLELSPKEAKAKLGEILSGLIEMKPTAPSLKRVKETL